MKTIRIEESIRTGSKLYGILAVLFVLFVGGFFALGALVSSGMASVQSALLALIAILAPSVIGHLISRDAPTVFVIELPPHIAYSLSQDRAACPRCKELVIVGADACGSCGVVYHKDAETVAG